MLKAAPFVLSKTVIAHQKNQDGILVYGIIDSLSREVIGIPSTVKHGTEQTRFDDRQHDGSRLSIRYPAGIRARGSIGSGGGR